MVSMDCRVKPGNDDEKRACRGSLREAKATKQSTFSRKRPWIASLTLAMTN
jgi:hypothetical protein